MPKINLTEQLKFGKTFCPLPFISYHTNVKKQRKLCCISPKVVDDTRLTEIRTDILNDVEVVECTKCYKQEESKLISRRQQLLRDWLVNEEDVVAAIETHLAGNEPAYVDYDLRYSNLCNLECQTCNATDSSSIALRAGIALPFLQYEPEIDINKNAKRIYFAGGEPFLIKSFSRLLDTVENTDCEIIINTNATTLSSHMLLSLDRFSNISFTVSIDGFGQLNEQIRKNSQWDKLESNLEILANRYNGYQGINVNTVVQKDNVNHLLELGQWIESKTITLWRLTVLDKPEEFHFSLNNNITIPDELLELPIVRSNIETLKTLEYIKDYAKTK